MKRKNKREMVGVVNNTLDVSEETRNEEKKKGEKCGNRDLLNCRLFHIYSIES